MAPNKASEPLKIFIVFFWFVMRALRTRYDMIAYLTLIATKSLITASLGEHHNYAKRIITCRQAIIVEFCTAKLTPILSFP